MAKKENEQEGYTMTVVEGGKKVTYRVTTQEVREGNTPYRVKVVEKVKETRVK